ncbi:hypothetical protein NOF55_05505 [Rhizobiaceae bacterium BDR2-2]|uniref:Uncharacterized protein n=1 Tax=Ectorhizobium quercum TaxID=2965071 RepID=A0AAE3MZI0_9HYPH|nr:hypothetical protein [Ectorhizobium quercum]MCX8996555.1 hypothetical protein [Ectorhizobium quercum]
MSTDTHAKHAETVQKASFSPMEKWILIALSTVPFSCLLLITDGFGSLTSHWL